MNIDMKPSGIRFILLEPGPFRTDFANESASMHLADTPIEAYNGLRENLHHVFRTMDGHQAGNPAKLAKGLIKVVNTENPPLRLLISKVSIPAVKEYYQNQYAEFEKWLNVSADSDYEE